MIVKVTSNKEIQHVEEHHGKVELICLVEQKKIWENIVRVNVQIKGKNITKGKIIIILNMG